MVKFQKSPNFNGILIEFRVEPRSHNDQEKHKYSGCQWDIVVPHHRLLDIWVPYFHFICQIDRKHHSQNKDTVQEQMCGNQGLDPVLKLVLAVDI